MVQKELAQRIFSPTNKKTYGRLSVVMQTMSHITPSIVVDPSNFSPPPKVYSQVIEISPLLLNKIVLTTEFNEFIKSCFVHKRKTLANNLSKFISKELVQKLALDKNQRAESLTPTQYIELFQKI
jgi:16S rRNA (adenine1518-N6/adenine1519-N6)-dimethyltransferase